MLERGKPILRIKLQMIQCFFELKQFIVAIFSSPNCLFFLTSVVRHFIQYLLFILEIVLLRSIIHSVVCGAVSSITSANMLTKFSLLFGRTNPHSLLPHTFTTLDLSVLSATTGMSKFSILAVLLSFTLTTPFSVIRRANMFIEFLNNEFFLHKNLVTSCKFYTYPRPPDFPAFPCILVATGIWRWR